MSTQLKNRYTLEEYFEIERSSEEKYEYFDGEIFNMSGASPQHEEVLGNTYAALKEKLRGTSCRVFLSNLKVKVPVFPPYRYPDLTALCDKPMYEKIGGLDALVNPSLIVEILSPSIEAYDRGDKFTYYKSIESFREYILVAQHRPHVTHYVKQASGEWSYEEINELESALQIASLDCEISFGAIYENIEFLSPSPYLDSSFDRTKR